MKTLIGLASLGLALLLPGCGSQTIQVVDAKTRLPVPLAAVLGKTGNQYSAPFYTNGNGMAPRPPGAVIEIRKPGYHTTTKDCR